MEWDDYKEALIKECKKHYKSKQYIDKYIKYSSRLFEKGLPVITSPSHFSALVGMDHQYVCNMANGTDSFYRTYSIKKKSGGNRIIDEPLPDLKFVQHWILEYILEKNSVSSYAKGFVKGKDLKSNARFHRSQKVLVNLDIKDFFPSISIYNVCNIFYEMGYSKKLSMFLSHLCCYHECLPQGAPTSPYLSNLMMRSFDNEITELIQTYKIRYTRYADDITVSGDFEPSTIIHYINKTLYKYGFRLNKNKTRVCRKNARQEVTGIVVNFYMQASKERRKKIRQEVYYIKKYGLESHLSHTKETRAHYLNNLLGRIGYVLYVNPKDNEMFGYYSYIMNLLMELKKS